MRFDQVKIPSLWCANPKFKLTHLLGAFNVRGVNRNLNLNLLLSALLLCGAAVGF